MMIDSLRRLQQRDLVDADEFALVVFVIEVDHDGGAGELLVVRIGQVFHEVRFVGFAVQVTFQFALPLLELFQARGRSHDGLKAFVVSVQHENSLLCGDALVYVSGVK